MIKITLKLTFLVIQITTITSNNKNYRLRDYRICHLKPKEVLLQFASSDEESHVVTTSSKPIVLIDDIKGFIHDAINTNTLTISNHNYTNEIISNSTNNILNNDKIRIIAKECSCDSDSLFGSMKNELYEKNSGSNDDNSYYCMNGNYCGIYKYNNIKQNVPNVICFDFSLKSAFVKNIFPVILLWYVALFTFFLISTTGKHVRNYIKSFFNSNETERLVDTRRQHEIYNMRLQQQLLLQQQHNRRRLSQPSISNNDVDNGATMLNDNEQLVLKVKRYYPNNSIINSSIAATEDNGNSEEQKSTNNKSKSIEKVKNNDNIECVTLNNKEINDISKEECITINSNKESNTQDENDNNETHCTICMIKINNGDKIGAISCNHTFHIHCLKQWLCRRNVCPLCLTPNIASIRTIDNSTTNNTNNLTHNSIIANPRYNASNHPSLLLLTASNHHHNVLAGSGIASGSVNMIASTFLNLDNVTNNIQNSFFGGNRNSGTNNNRDDDRV